MISILKGQVVEKNLETITVSVSGVGFEVSLAPRHLLRLNEGEETLIHTRMIVREDEILLYGFASKIEREQFDLLCSVSGVGPKLAMTVIAGLDAASFSEAIANQDEQVFRNIAGIGPKTAKLILISLAGKAQLVVSPTANRVLLALKQLGTEEGLARKTISRLDQNLSESEMLKKALQTIGKGNS